MLGRWLCYIRLGFLDLVRLWPTTQHHIIIVAGICLPILVLLGLKRGHVADLRSALLKSATGRQVVFGSGKRGELLTPESIKRLEKDLGPVEVIIPDVYRLVNLQVPNQKQQTKQVDGVTLFATSENDPLLTPLGATLPRPNERAIILNRVVANKLGVKNGNKIQVATIRQIGGKSEIATVDLQVSSIVDLNDPDALIGYVDTGVLDRIVAYVQGHRVVDYGWPAAGNQFGVQYQQWLGICRAEKDFNADDRLELELRFKLTDINKSIPDPLSRLLNPDKRSKLKFYHITDYNPGQELNDPSQSTVYDPDATPHADEVVIPWTDPITTKIGAETWTLVGLTSRRLRWFKADKFLREEAVPLSSVEDPFQIRIIESSDPVDRESIDWPLRDGQQLKLRVHKDIQKKSPAKGVLAIAPPELLVWLTKHQAGKLEFDPRSKLFIQPPPPPRYNRARLYANTIDDVPTIVDALAQRDFSFSAEQVQIREIQKQDASLQMLVYVVGTGVFLFGILTVVSVLHDSTDRKRGTIGILRVMGTSRRGIFLLIFVRGAIIGILASVLCAALGLLLAIALNWNPGAESGFAQWKPVISVQIEWRDYLYVLAGALLCCGIGALLPAWKASRLDPVEAIIEGRFR